jgi:asparagine N-glycosylation enzyme membrane subunit Stt3
VKTPAAGAITNPPLEQKRPGVGAADTQIEQRPLIPAGAAFHWALIITAAALVTWIRLLPLSPGVLDDDAALRVWYRRARTIAATLPPDVPAANRPAELRRQVDQWRQDHRGEFNAECEQVAARLKSELSHAGADGVQRVILGDYDSYHWLRMARNYLRTGTTCDAAVDGQCRDTYANAPVGRRNVYNRSLHIAAIVALHRLITLFKPAYPLDASSFLVPVIVGVLGVFPAFAIGARLAGALGGLCAALLTAINPLFLVRSIGSDDDVWNIVLPLFMVWTLIDALSASRPRRQAGFALLAAAFVGLHAATWTGWTFTYAVVMLAMMATLLLEFLGWVVSRYSGRSWSPANLKRAALVMVVFYLAAGFFTTAAAGVAGYFTIPLELIKPLSAAPHPSAAAAQIAWWPDVFSTVAELTPQDLGTIAGKMGAPVYFFVSWLGLLLLLVPRGGWKLPHFALLIGGNYLYWHLLAASQVGRLNLLVLLASPLAAAVLIDLFSQRVLSDDLGAVLIVVAWFLGALFLSYQGPRFVMLMVPPFAITFGVALGRLQQWAEPRVCLFRPSAAWITRLALFAVLAAVLILPVRQGYAAARSYLPKLNAAWWSMLSVLRQQSPPDAIVNTWWDYGYWAKYVAERRVNNDGGSLRTHIPYWTARALAAPSERETAGLLRMLDCGSDATPEPEGNEGAYGKLLSYGVDGLKAETIIGELARMGRRQAQAYLAEQKLSVSAQADILRSTHCDPPASYLLLTSVMEPLAGWWYLANCDFRRAYVVNRARLMPEAPAIAELVSRLGYSKDEARSLYQRAASLRSQPEEQKFIEPKMNSVNSAWFKCDRSDGADLACEMDVRLDKATVAKQVIFRSANPADSRVVAVHDIADTGGTTEEVKLTPAVIVIAAADQMREVSNPEPESSELAVLVDVPGARVRLSTPELLHSTFNRLMYLDGRYGQLFDKVHEETGFGGERVTLWRINWQRLEAFDNGG